MKTMKRKFMFLALLPLLASCSIYHPQAVDMPLINHAGDVRVDANLSMSAWLVPDATNLNLTGSVGITDALAGQLHVNYGGDNAYVQAAPGIYFPVGENFVVETYAGFGYGGAFGGFGAFRRLGIFGGGVASARREQQRKHYGEYAE